MHVILTSLGVLVYKLPAALGLREVHEDDQAFLDVLYASRREDLRQMPMDAAFIAQMIKMQQHVQMEGVRLNYPEARHVIVEHAGQPVGRVIIHAGSDELRLIDIAIIPSAQRQGIAKTILLALQADAQDQGKGVSLAVEQTNFAARGLYLKLGFVALGADALFEQMHWQAQELAGTNTLNEVLPANTLANKITQQGQFDATA
ncbi:acetyltransferase (GNAT) family protein [Undibacterium pigrum]|uniref:Acetyltransferase (GNAT) family protein n=1 Tax=Undibacterium pigrum TaxID=401470 RepID=A0A318IMW4_9BURK|nr:acetyltransferase (GNAT) family protein [Undibacterium pigrum]